MTTLSINPQDTWALLIGVGKFTDEDLCAIPAVSNNLVQLRQLLENSAIVGIPNKQILVIKDQDNIIQQMEKWLPSRPVETLFIYYVGHGIADVDQQHLRLAVPNTLNRNPKTAFPFVDMWDETSRRATNLIYMLDCCFSGKALKTIRKQVGKNISVLTATLPNENAKAPKNEEHSSFTKHLIELLENGFGKSPTLTTTGIYKELGQRLSKEGSPKPWGEDFLDTEESLQITYNRSFPPKPSSSPKLLTTWKVIVTRSKSFWNNSRNYAKTS